MDQEPAEPVKERSKSFFSLFPGIKVGDDLLRRLIDEKSLESFVNDQIQIYESSNKKRIKPRCVYSDSDSDEELKLQLKNAVKQYKRNKKEENSTQNVSPVNNERSKSSYDEINKKENISMKLYKGTNPVKDLSRESKANVNGEIEGNESATSDIQQLINFFFLKKIDGPGGTEVKKYSDYEKQGAMPKSKFRELLDENAFGGVREKEYLKSKTKGVSSEQRNTRYKLNFPMTVPEQNSNDRIVRISERICSKPFFYIVPENPCPNFLFSRGSYYVIPKHPDSLSGEKIILHPERTVELMINGNGDFEIKDSQSHFPKSPKVRDMNDLGKAVLQKTDSHLNIGPRDVKHSDFYSNLEANYVPHKIYNKCPIMSEDSVDGVASPLGKSGSLKGTEARQEESGQPNKRLDRSEKDEVSDTQEGEVSEAQQLLMLEFPELDAASVQNVAANYNLEDGSLIAFIAAKKLEKKIEEQLLKMLSALPESNFEELREICDQFQGDEEQVNRYIENCKSEAIKRQLVLEMQLIFPDADPDYLYQEIEKVGGMKDAVNNLTDRMLDEGDYPKILNCDIDAESRRLWKVYVENFNVEDYIRNVPNPENLKHEATEEYRQLALIFLRARYPEVSSNLLKNTFDYYKTVMGACTSDALSGSFYVRLADTSLKKNKFDEAFLKEICYVDNKEEIDQYVADLKELKEVELEEARLNEMFLLCPLCCNDEVVASDAFTCPEGHLFCKDCVKRYVFVKLGDGLFKFPCPSDDCETFFSHATLEKLLPDSILSKIVKKQQAAEISIAKVDGLESCPHCEFAYIPNPDDMIFKCQNVECLIETCRKCHEKNHIPLRCEEVERPKDVEARKKIEETMTEKLVRICPLCFKKFVKEDGCNKMICTCGTIVCYYCRRKINGYDHFQRTPSEVGKCPLYSNNETLHVREVVQAGIEARNEILRKDPNIRISEVKEM